MQARDWGPEQLHSLSAAWTWFSESTSWQPGKDKACPKALAQGATAAPPRGPPRPLPGRSSPEATIAWSEERGHALRGQDCTAEARTGAGIQAPVE